MPTASRFSCRRLFSLGALLILPLSSSLEAAAYTFIGAGADANWFTAANWSPNGTPNTGDFTRFNESDALISGAAARTGTLYGGDTAGATSQLTVSGSGASLDVSQSTTWGGAGAGLLTIEAGGSFTTSGQFNLAGGGTVLVTGTGSSWSSVHNVFLGYGGTTAAMKVEAGATASTAYNLIVAMGAGDKGVLTVDGAGSTFTIGQYGWLELGAAGTGEITVRNGGFFLNNGYYSYLGGDAGTQGTALVTGTGSTWTDTELYVGRYAGSTGSFTVADGADYNGRNLWLGNAGSTGTLTVTGTGSEADLSGYISMGNGANSSGTLNVLEGGTFISDGSLYSGQDGGVGTVTISGQNSRLEAYQMSSGYGGTGSIVVENGGYLSADSLTVGSEGGSATMTVTGAGSSFTGTGWGSISVGYTNWTPGTSGTLTISDGAVVTGGSLGIGQGEGTTGTVTVTGAGSRLNISGNTYLDGYGTGILTVEQGASGSSTRLSIGGASDAPGSGLMTLSDATWTNTGELFIKSGATGSSVVVKDGSTLTNTGDMNLDAGGTLLVTGAGSRLESTSYLLGRGGAFRVEAGAAANTGYGLIGYYLGSSTASVTGTGSKWTIDGDLEIGDIEWGEEPYSGAVTVSNGGNITTTGEMLLKLGSLTAESGGTLTSSRILVNENTTLRGSGSGAALGSGTLELNGGRVEVAGDSAQTFARNVGLTANSTVVSDRVTNGAGTTQTLGTLTISENRLSVRKGGNVTGGTATVAFGNTTINGNATFDVESGAALRLGAMTGGTTVARVLTKIGSGTLTFGAAAGFFRTGSSLVINGGTAEVATANALGDSTVPFTVTVNSTTAGDTASFDLLNVNQTIAGLTFGGTGATATSANAVNTGTGTLTLTGNVTYSNTNNPLGASISGRLALGGTGRLFLINDSTNAANDLTISAVITGNGGLTKAGTGTLLLSGANIYSGTTMLNQGSIKVGSNSALGQSGLTLNGGTLMADGTTALSLTNAITLQAQSTIGGEGNLSLGTLTNSNNLTLNISNTGATTIDRVFLSNSNTGRTLTLNVTGGDTTITGVIANRNTTGSAGSLSKTGSGKLILTGANTYTGLTTVSGGTLQIGNGGTTGSITGNITNNAKVIFNRSDAHTFSGLMSGTGSFEKLGAGVTTLSRAAGNTYSGGTKVSEGTLTISNTSGSALGTGSVEVSAGATLAGTGSFSGALTLDGTISPGNSPGRLTTGSQTWNGGASYLWEMNNATGTAGQDPGWDEIFINGSLTIAATQGDAFTIVLTTLTLSNTAGLAANFDGNTNYSWTIAATTGGIVGFDVAKFVIDETAFANTHAGQFSLAAENNNLNLVYTVPEPTTGAMVGLGALLMLRAIRRRD